MTLKERLLGKRILFFSVQTFNLEKKITHKLESYGAEVEYFDERPSNSKISKGIIRLKRSIYQKKINTYYKTILSNTKNRKYDFLFVNRGEVVPEFFLDQFKKENPNCECIFYTWDSFENHDHPLKILKYFDYKFSFDPKDCKNYGLILRPLFFLDRIKKIKKESNNSFRYDLLFLGTAHSDRYQITNKIVEWCEQKELVPYYYYYMQGKSVYLFKRLFDKSFQKFDYKKLSFKSLSTEEVLELYKDSKIFLDINHPGQTGLTLRTFEAIGCRRKMITTNKEIEKYPFFDPKNILVIDRDNVELDESFFNSGYKELSPSLYQKASMEGWLHDIFVRDNTEFWANDVLK